MTERLSLLTCKRCGCQIDAGLCGSFCELDGTPVIERRPDDLEVRVYAFVGVEGAAPLPASAALLALIEQWREEAKHCDNSGESAVFLRGEDAGYAHCYRECADELEAALSRADQP